VTDLDRSPIEKPKVKEKEIVLEYTERRIYQSFQQIVATGDQLITLPGAAAFGVGQEALDINNFDEVADSTWFTNRLGRSNIPAVKNAPPVFGRTVPVTILISGPSPRFVVEDSVGEKVMLKFDTNETPGLSTGAELIANRLLFAAGYNLPDCYIINFDLTTLKIGKDAKVGTNYNDVHPLTQADLETAVKTIIDGKKRHIRTLALKAMPGDVIGPFSFSGKRGDDSNDRIPHEHRRELRGYKVFSSYLNSTNSLVAETMDMFIPVEKEKGYLQHYLFDLSSAFGDGKSPFEPADPLSWSPKYPNRAFNLMTPRDAFWAAHILSKLPDGLIEEIVKKAEFPRHETTSDFIKNLKERRDKIIKYWFAKIPPIVEFSLDSDDNGFVVSFKNLSANEKFHYRYQLRSYSGRQRLIDWTETSTPAIRADGNISHRMKEKRLYTLRLQAKKENDKWWSPSIDIYLMKENGRTTMLGFQRCYNR